MTDRDDDHPADQLIRELIAQPRSATDEEIRLITERIATAPFSTEIQKVPVLEHGFTDQGITLGTQADSLTLHFIHHVVMEAQWLSGTTTDMYVESLHRAARTPNPRIALYRQWGTRNIVAIIARTEDVFLPEQRDVDTLPNLLVVYRADRGIIISGYQFSTMEKVHIPEDALWLK